MYRRRQPRIQKSEETKPVEKKVERKEEPVIKAVVKPQRKVTVEEFCPMVNILRDIKYFGEQDEEGSEHYYVPFNTMIDIALSKGYLNVNETEYYKKSEDDWSESYQDTTNWKRDTFMCGDVIYTHDTHTSFAFLITKVYKGQAADNSISSELKMDPPVGPKEDNSENEQILSSFVACTGTVYMFKEGVTLGQISGHVSTLGEGGAYRKLYPTNVSKYDKRNDDPSFTSCKITEEQMPKDYPAKEDLPKKLDDTETALKNQFNLASGVVVEGWLIYMKSTVNSESSSSEDVQGPTNIIGDIIRTGPIVVSVLSKTTLNLGSTYSLPFYLESGNNQMTFNGDSTKFASEPLNSEHYQTNYSDSQSFKRVTVGATDIYSLKQISVKLNEEDSNDGSNDNTGN